MIDDTELGRVLVVVVHHADVGATIECLRTTVRGLDHLDSAGIIIVNNSADAEDAMRLRKHLDTNGKRRGRDYQQLWSQYAGRRVELRLLTAKNGGYGHACNLGARIGLAQSAVPIDWIVFLNNDVVVGPNCIRTLIVRALSDSSVWVVAPGISGPGVGTDILSWSFSPSTTRKRRSRSTNHELTGPGQYLEGSILLLRAQYYPQVSFDERFFLYFEDLDLCEQVRMAGGTVVSEPRARAWHWGGTSTQGHRGVLRSSQIAAFHTNRSLMLYLHKWRRGSRLWALVVRVPHAILLGVSSGFSVAWAGLRGLYAGLIDAKRFS